MFQSSENNKRIAKNTIILYVRMIFLMAISLYTSRVVLAELGVSDFGIYNVVGGVVAMFSILSSSLSSAISRYLTFELGRGDMGNLKRVFSTSVSVQIVMAITVMIIAEIGGTWLLNTHINIPEGRMNAANWVLHCSIIYFGINLVSVPYNASIISHEHMRAFAYISILEAVLKLIVVFTLSISPVDKLKTYAILLVLTTLLIRIVYGTYCKRHFEECTYHFTYNKKLLKEMTNFAGWTFFGNIAHMLNTQGVNVLTNIFFGVTLNVARGIAIQVESAIMQFVHNFMTALTPQITKSYAAGELSYMNMLVCRGAKYSFFLMLFFALPICLETKQILTIWLKIVPDYTVTFIRLSFLNSMFAVIAHTLAVSQLATGKIKKSQIVITSWEMWVFPLSWLGFKIGLSPASSYIIYAFIYFVLIFVRLYMVKDLIKLSWWKYTKEVIFRSMLVGIIAFVIPFLLYKNQQETIVRLIEVCVTSALVTMVSIYFIGMDKMERKKVIAQIKKMLKY